MGTIYPAKLHLKKTLAALPQFYKGQLPTILYLEGDLSRRRHDTDRDLHFRQDSNFYYLTGCDLPGSRLLVDTNVKTALFVPGMDHDAVMWSGLPPSLEEIASSHEVDEVYTMDKFASHLKKLLQKPSTLLTLPYTDTPSGVDDVDKTALQPALEEARLVKTPFEIQLLQKANDISSMAHASVMEQIGKNAFKSEYEASAYFEYKCKFAGSRSFA